MSIQGFYLIILHYLCWMSNSPCVTFFWMSSFVCLFEPLMTIDFPSCLTEKTNQYIKKYYEYLNIIFTILVSLSGEFFSASHCKGDAFLLRVSSLWLDWSREPTHSYIYPIDSQFPSTAPLEIQLKNSYLD